MCHYGLVLAALVSFFIMGCGVSPTPTPTPNTQATIVAAVAATQTAVADGAPATPTLAGTETKPATTVAASPAPTEPQPPIPQSTDEPPAPPTEMPQPTEEPVPELEPTPTAAPRPVGQSRSNPHALGSRVRVGIWHVTVKSILRGEQAERAILKANQFNAKPRQGHQYLLVSLEVQNISKQQEPQDPSFGLSGGVTGRRNVLYPRASLVLPKPLEGQLYPRGKASGQMAFEIPSDENNALLRLEETLGFGEETQRYIAIDKGAKIMPNPAIAATEPTNVGIARDRPAKPGQRVTSDNWQVEVLETIRGPQAAKRVKAANQFNKSAPKGHEYLVVKIRVQYIAEENPHTPVSVDGTYLRITGQKNVIYKFASVVAPAPRLEARLFPGGVVEGWAVLQAGKGEQGLMLIFQPVFSFDDEDRRFLALK